MMLLYACSKVALTKVYTSYDQEGSRDHEAIQEQGVGIADACMVIGDGAITDGCGNSCYISTRPLEYE